MTEHQVPDKKQTVLGLYVTAQEAYEMWRADPEGVKILDVRTPEEYIFVGHPAMAKNIPLLFIKYQWDVEKNQPVVAPNPDFATAVLDRLRSRRRDLRHVPFRRPQCAGRQWPRESGLRESLQRHRRFRGRQGRRSGQRLPWQTYEERLEELRVAVDLRRRPEPAMGF